MLLREWETHRSRLDYIYGEVGNPIGVLQFDWERDAQEATYNTWMSTLGTPPPLYFVEQEIFDDELSDLIEEYRKGLGEEYSDWSDIGIQAKFTADLKTAHAEDVAAKEAVDLVNSPVNGKYKDDKHAREPCEALRPNE